MLQFAAMDRTVPVREIIGIGVSDFTRNQAFRELNEAFAERFFTPVAFLNAHSANVAITNAAHAQALERFTVLADGLGVDMAARVLHGRPFRANLNGTDFVPDLLRQAEFPLKVGLLGARPEVADNAVDAFRRIDARHDYRLIHHGFFDADEQSAFLAELKEWRPDVLLVALGVPKQEIWIAENLTRDHCTVPMAVGALFDFVTGTVPRAPERLRSARVEWMFRLWQEPGRLWRRYLVGSPVFLLRVMARRARGRHA